MDLLRDKVRPIYFKYLASAFGGALISSIYGVVDMAMVGQYHGPEGTAAMAVISPVWNILYSLGLLTGIGGSVLYSSAKGSAGDGRRANEYFTVATVLTAALSLAAWAGIVWGDDALLRLFGAEETLMPLAKRYLYPVKFGVPCFLFGQLLTAFLRNDGDPGLATRAVIFGGALNVFGDWFFVFRLDLGILGAGLATVLCNAVSLLVMLTHFHGRKNTLRLVRPTAFWDKTGRIFTTGFSTFFADVAMGILTTLFNRQILRYLGTDALSVYGIIINISTFVQCCAYSIGQAAQPILSVNYGAGRRDRLGEVLRYAVATAAVFGVIWTALVLAGPNLFVRIFMAPTESVLAIAPGIIRRYGLSFLLLPFNVVCTYYFQSVLRPGTAFVISIARGAVISGLLILLLPLAAGGAAIWFAMPITELLVCAFAALEMRRRPQA